MNARDHADEQWDANLRSMAETMDIPAAVPRELRMQCVAVLKGEIKVKNHQRSWRTAVFSTVGVAAAIIVLFGFLGMPHGQTEVNAAVILRTLNEQVQASNGISITIDSIVLEGISLDGQVQISSAGIAGDIKVAVEAADDRPSVDIDAAIGIKSGSGWVLLRKLNIGDPQFQSIAWMIAPPGQETLLLLPVEDMDMSFGADLSDFKDHKFGELIGALVESQVEVGATIEDQADGTILLTLPIKDSKTLDALRHIGEIPHGETLSLGGGGEVDTTGAHVDLKVQLKGFEGGEEEPAVHEEAHHRAETEDSELIGVTFKVLYDPAAGTVRWFKIEDFGEANGSINISFDQVAMDPSRLDKESVMDEDIRVVDLAALKEMFGVHVTTKVEEGEDDDNDD